MFLQKYRMMKEDGLRRFNEEEDIESKDLRLMFRIWIRWLPRSMCTTFLRGGIVQCYGGFIKVKDAADMVHKINCIRYNNGSLKANIAKFSRDGQRMMPLVNTYSKKGDEGRTRPVQSIDGRSNFDPLKSVRTFKEVVAGEKEIDAVFNNCYDTGSEMESEDWLHDDDGNNCDNGSFVEDSEVECDLEKGDDVYFSTANRGVSQNSKEIANSKFEVEKETEGSAHGEKEDTAHEERSSGNEESQKVVEDTTFQEDRESNTHEVNRGISGKDYNKDGSVEMLGSRDFYNKAKSDGCISPNKIPDLNNPLPVSDPIRKHKAISKLKSNKSMSVKFKDIIQSSQGRKSSKKTKKTTSNCNSKNTSEISPSSVEIEQTMKVGNSIGYQLEGAEKEIEEILKGEGDYVRSK
ncbi:hypothetical protein L1887_22494 [Cichorium endivia]|nr:hypothetical protein L1887_22494 [Cichorium endivia]